MGVKKKGKWLIIKIFYLYSGVNTPAAGCLVGPASIIIILTDLTLLNRFQ